MRSIHDERARGWWQFVVFGLSLLVAIFVYVIEPEPEESRIGYTADGCFEKGSQLFSQAMKLRGARRVRSELLLSALRYFEALEKRFGVGVEHIEIYEKMADARTELAELYTADPLLAASLRIDTAPQLLMAASGAFHSALRYSHLREATKLRVERKHAKVLIALSDDKEALHILRNLLKIYRSRAVERLRIDRGEASLLADAGTTKGLDAEARTSAARDVYFLTGFAAMRAAGNAKNNAEATVLFNEGERAYRLFLDASGEGERRAIALLALANRAFSRAAITSGENKKRLLTDARKRYAAVGTKEAAFMLARVLFELGEYKNALERFAVLSDELSTEVIRARSFMRGMCYLKLNQLDDAEMVFADLALGAEPDMESKAAHVGLAEIYLARGNNEEAAKHLMASALVLATQSSVELPVRDIWISPMGLSGQLIRVAEAFSADGNTERAIELYAQAASLSSNRRVLVLTRMANAWEQLAANRPEQRNEFIKKAAWEYLKISKELPVGAKRREALCLAVESFEMAGAYIDACRTAEQFLLSAEDDDLATRIRHLYGKMAVKLGRYQMAIKIFEANINSQTSDIYVDKSLAALLELLVEQNGINELTHARRLANSILDSNDLGARYNKNTLVYLLATMLLPRVNVALVGKNHDLDVEQRVCLFKEAHSIAQLAKAELAANVYMRDGVGARPEFYAIVNKYNSSLEFAHASAVYGWAKLIRTKDNTKATELMNAASKMFAALKEKTQSIDASAMALLAKSANDMFGNSAAGAADILAKSNNEDAILATNIWRDWVSRIYKSSNGGNY